MFLARRRRHAALAARGGFGGPGAASGDLICEGPARNSGRVFGSAPVRGHAVPGPRPAGNPSANARHSPGRQLQSSAMPAQRSKRRSCACSDVGESTKRCAASGRRGLPLKYRAACDDWDDGLPRDIAKCCPSIARDTQTDVSLTARGVWYVIRGQKPIRGSAAARTRGSTTQTA